MEIRVGDLGVGVPIPRMANSTDNGGSIAGALRDMAVGQCKTFSGADRAGRESVRVQSARIAGEDNMKFKTRTIDGVLHVWRVA